MGARGPGSRSCGPRRLPGPGPGPRPAAVRSPAAVLAAWAPTGVRRCRRPGTRPPCTCTRTCTSMDTRTGTSTSTSTHAAGRPGVWAGGRAGPRGPPKWAAVQSRARGAVGSSRGPRRPPALLRLACWLGRAVVGAPRAGRQAGGRLAPRTCQAPLRSEEFQIGDRFPHSPPLPLSQPSPSRSSLVPPVTAEVLPRRASVEEGVAMRPA